MTAQVRVKAWGDSFGIRIPEMIMAELSLKQDDILQLETSEDTIIIKKAFRHRTFEERLHEFDGIITTVPFDWGEPKGREIL